MHSRFDRNIEDVLGPDIKNALIAALENPLSIKVIESISSLSP
jgi:hypothetical protein